jgi:hypothetical protein
MAWTELTRRQHERVGGKYASDLTDAEWAVMAPLKPPRRMAGALAQRNYAMFLTRSFIVQQLVASGGCCPMTFRPCRWCGVIFMHGAMTACSM